MNQVGSRLVIVLGVFIFAHVIPITSTIPKTTSSTTHTAQHTLYSPSLHHSNPPITLIPSLRSVIPSNLPKPSQTRNCHPKPLLPSHLINPPQKCKAKDTYLRGPIQMQGIITLLDKHSRTRDSGHSSHPSRVTLLRYPTLAGNTYNGCNFKAWKHDRGIDGTLETDVKAQNSMVKVQRILPGAMIILLRRRRRSTEHTITAQV